MEKAYKQFVLTGIRPTGPLHLGHYVGALKQWLEIQKQDGYDCYFLIADIQALTTHSEHPKLIEDAVRQVTLDFLAVGLDPNRDNVHFVLQSAIPELTELTVYLSMITPFSWMESNPTIKSEMSLLQKSSESITTGFMYYPVSQAADILFVSPDPKLSETSVLVPVGEDQIPHLQDTNRIVRKFNRVYGECFVECEPLVGDIGRLVGIDGQTKMSKSLGNSISLSDDPETIRKIVMSMYTDPKRIRATDPGTVEGNPVFIYHDAFNPNRELVEDLKARYRLGEVGDVEVKMYLNDALQKFLLPIRERRMKSENLDIRGILEKGTSEARVLAIETTERVRDFMHLNYKNLNRQD
jgi:tryptophanyl-tRNA synthetase